MKQLIDYALYALTNEATHRWASENKAKVRGYGLAVLLVVFTYAEQYIPIPEEIKTEITAIVLGGGAVATARNTHNNVSPWEGEDA